MPDRKLGVMDASRTKMAAIALDAIGGLPYFKGKGMLALGVLRLFRRAQPLTLRLANGSRLWIDDGVVRQTVLPYWIGRYEAEVLRVLRRCLARIRPGEDFMDVGANVGFYSVFAARELAAFSSRVHSFEPNPLVFDELRHNVELNGLSNVVLCRCGVGREVSTQILHTSAVAVTQASLRPVQDFLDGPVEVAVTTLDAYRRERAVGSVGLVKLDIEGGELPALRGAPHLLGEDQPFIVLEEFQAAARRFGYEVRELRECLLDLGYRLFLIEAALRREPTLTPLRMQDPPSAATQNVLAVPRSRSL